jgi:hypothetical protein
VNTAWSENFSYDYFVRILRTVREKFNLRLLEDGLAAQSAQPQLFLRHDVDVSINRALAMAEIEAEHGVQATYMFIPNSRLYDIQRDRELLRRFISLNHEVSLHFDVDEHGRGQEATISDVLIGLERDCQIISDITSKPVRSISFHRPMPQFLRGELTVAGRTNAYAAILMESYISDSKGEWRSGEPLGFLQATTEPIVQLLIHPIWWGIRHMKARERLEEFYQDETAELEPAARDQFDTDLAFTVPAVRRLNHTEA